MADQKVKVFDGTSWVGIESSSTLPISNEEESVKLDGESDVFTVSINGSQRLLVDDDSSDFAGEIRCNDFLSTVETNPSEIQLTSNIVFECLKLTRFNASGTTVVEVNGESKGVGINTVASDKAGLTVKTSVVNPTYGTQGVWSNGSVSATTQAARYFDSFLSQPIIASASTCEVYHFRAYDNAASTTTGNHAGFVAFGLNASTTKNIGFWSQVARDDTKQNYAFYASSTAPSFFNGDIQCKVLRGQIDSSPAAMSFVGNDVSFSGETVIFDCGPTPGLNFDISQNTTGAVGGTGVLLLTRQYDLSFGSNTIRFNSDYNSGGKLVHWVMENDGGLVGTSPSSVYPAGGYVQVPCIKGMNTTDTEIKLDGNATIAKADGTVFTPSVNSSIATKKYVDDEITNAGGGGGSISAGTPTSETAPDSDAGSMLFDDSFLWIKTSTAWKKIPLAAFGEVASNVTVQLTQAAFDAIAEPSPNILYVIVGD